MHEPLYLKALFPSPLSVEASLKKSPLKVDENDDDSEGRFETSPVGLVKEYRFMLVVSVGEVIENNDEGADTRELVSE